MKKIFKLFIVVFLFFSCFSCNKADDPNFEKYDKVFINTFYFNDKVEENIIKSIEAYYYNSHYYYDVIFYNEYFKKDLRMLYDLKYEHLFTHYNLNDEQVTKEHHPEDYNDFITAKEKRISNTYTEEDIKWLVEYYESTL